jgi:hypothetical protein
MKSSFEGGINTDTELEFSRLKAAIIALILHTCARVTGAPGFPSLRVTSTLPLMLPRHYSIAPRAG